MDRIYRAVLVGLGNIAWRFDRLPGGMPCLTHAGALLRHPRTKIVGGCSPEEQDRLEFEAAFGVPTYTAVEELIDQTEPDIVSVCSPSTMHYEHAQCALTRGVPMVWLEKPPASSTTQLKALNRDREKHGATVLVNYQRRYLECYNVLRSFYREARLGRCNEIQISYSCGLEQNGAHLFDILFFIVGEEVPYRLEGPVRYGGGDNPSFSVSFDDGRGVTVSGLQVPYHCIDISLICDEGRVSVLHGGMTPVLEEKVEHELFKGFFRLSFVDAGPLGRGGLDGGMEAALADLVGAYETSSSPASSLQTAHACQELIERVQQNAFPSKHGSICVG